jgi:acetyl esterase/lipase
VEETLRYRALVDALWSLRGPEHFDNPIPVERSVPYRAHAAPGIAPLGDVYVPLSDARGSSVVLVHGGGFVIGSRRMKPMRYLAARLLEAGIAAFVFDYRLVFRGGGVREATDDVLCALDFWRTRAPRFGLDPARISLVGLSAGATLSMLAAGRASPGALHRLVSVFGLYELDHLQGPLATLLPRLAFDTADRTEWEARSPRHAPQPTISTLLLHGTSDGLVPVEQARRLAAHRASLGLPTKLALYDGAPHGFFNTPCDACEQGARDIVEHVR